MEHARRLARVGLLLLLGAARQLQAQERAFDEYQVKAAFLFNLAKFVDWPPGAFARSTDPIVICIAGQNFFGSTLEEIGHGKTVGIRPFAVRRLPDAQRAGDCHILFIGAEEWKRNPTLAEALKAAPILTVGETADFASIGGIVSLRLESPRIHIQVSLDAADRAGIRISSKLLSLAEIVKRQR